MRSVYQFIPLILLLSGCLAAGPVAAPPKYEQPPKPGGRMCAFECRNAKNHCEDGCGLQERACTNKMQAQAIKDYEAYARAQFATRAPMDLRPRDFETPERCVPVSCLGACDSVYDECFEKCGGKIVR